MRCARQADGRSPRHRVQPVLTMPACAQSAKWFSNYTGALERKQAKSAAEVGNDDDTTGSEQEDERDTVLSDSSESD